MVGYVTLPVDPRFRRGPVGQRLDAAVGRCRIDSLRAMIGSTPSAAAGRPGFRETVTCQRIRTCRCHRTPARPGGADRPNPGLCRTFWLVTAMPGPTQSVQYRSKWGTRKSALAVFACHGSARVRAPRRSPRLWVSLEPASTATSRPRRANAPRPQHNHQRHPEDQQFGGLGRLPKRGAYFAAHRSFGIPGPPWVQPN